MEFCLICKEIVGKRYRVRASDAEQDNRIDGHICRDCWLSFISSQSNEGHFKIMKFRSWIKGDKDGKRL